MKVIIRFLLVKSMLRNMYIGRNEKFMNLHTEMECISIEELQKIFEWILKGKYESMTN